MDMNTYNPNACPTCGGTDFSVYDESADSINVWKSLACKACGQRWKEEYTLNHVWLAEEDN